jgi:type I restriction enzyme M protein
VALPKDLFYNTGIYTYIWFITNKKEPHRKGKVQLINAVDFCKPEKKSLGNKRNKILDEHLAEIEKLYTAFTENDQCKIFSNESFGYYQLTVMRPEEDENGNFVYGKNNKMQYIKDTDNVPLSEDIMEYYWKEIVANIGEEAWIDYDKTRIGYEINFTRYFHKPQKTDSSVKIKKEIVALEKNIQDLLKKVLEK